MKILTNENSIICNKQTIDEIKESINRFRFSKCSEFTRNKRDGSIPSTSPMAIDFPKDMINELINQDNCSGVRIYFNAEGGTDSLDKDGFLSVILVGYDEDKNDILSVNKQGNVVEILNNIPDQIKCCGENPPKSGLTTEVINFKAVV